jgi:hypothetical protein
VQPSAVGWAESRQEGSPLMQPASEFLLELVAGAVLVCSTPPMHSRLCVVP